MHGKLTVAGATLAALAAASERRSAPVVDRRCSMGRRGIVLRARVRTATTPGRAGGGNRRRTRRGGIGRLRQRRVRDDRAQGAQRRRCHGDVGSRHGSRRCPTLCRSRRREPAGAQRDRPHARSRPAGRPHRVAPRPSRRQPTDRVRSSPASTRSTSPASKRWPSSPRRIDTTAGDIHDAVESIRRRQCWPGRRRSRRHRSFDTGRC